MTLSSKLSGFYWHFPGHASGSYKHVVKSIQADKRLSQKRKDELIEDITYLCGHIISNCDSSIRNNYTSAHSSGIKWMKFSICEKPTKWFSWLFYGTIREIAMQRDLNSLSSLHDVERRIGEEANRLEQEFIDKKS